MAGRDNYSDFVDPISGSTLIGVANMWAPTEPNGMSRFEWFMLAGWFKTSQELIVIDIGDVSPSPYMDTQTVLMCVKDPPLGNYLYEVMNIYFQTATALAYHNYQTL